MIRMDQIPDEVVAAFYGTPLHGLIPEILEKAFAAWPGLDVETYVKYAVVPLTINSDREPRT